MKQTKDSPLTKEERNAIRFERLRRKIYHFYEQFSRIAPIVLMLWHWYSLWDYSCLPHPTVTDIEDNGSSIIFQYTCLYLYLPAALIPATFFFHWCWIYRIPFYYFFGINPIRLYYQHWMMTPEQIPAHFALIALTIIVYAYGITTTYIKNSKCSQNA